MKPQALTPFLLFSFAVALPACQSGELASVGGDSQALISPPTSCGPGDPTCKVATDEPEQSELTQTNSSNLASAAGTGLQLIPGSGSIVDNDGDGVPDAADDCPGPGWRIPCDGDASNDGLYQTTYYGSAGQYTLGADVNVDGKIRAADVYILMDATGSMTGEQQQLIKDLTTGTFIPATECAGASDTGLVGSLKCVVDDVWMGLGQFNEFPLHPHGHPYRYAPYHHHLDVTDNLQDLLFAVSALTVTFNKDVPEAATQAMYSVATGQGLGPWVPNRAGCAAGRWGYPCFRPNALPVLMLFTDAQMINGPIAGGPTYGNPPFDNTVGLATRLPPVEQDRAMIYSSDDTTAHDLGDLSMKSVTVMGTNVNFGDDYKTWNLGTCGACNTDTPPKCYGDGNDGVVRFSVSPAWEASLGSAFVSGEGSFYPRTNIALFNSVTGLLDCNHGPETGNDYWGRMNHNLTAGTWYAVSDAEVHWDYGAASNVGPFQIRIQTTASDSSWETKRAPVTWTEVETALLGRAIKVVSIVSQGDDGYTPEDEADELGRVTGSVDQFGQPYRSTIAFDGTGLTTGVLDAVRSLVGDTRRDISIIAEDNPATAGVDESRFVDTIIASACPTVGINNCLGGQGTSTCQGCLADSLLSFEFRLGNDFVPQAAVDQVFEFDLVSLADGSVELSRIPVRVMVPATGTGFGDGFYENTYDSDVVCEIPPDRPNWGALTWTNLVTPSDSAIEFEVSTADSLAELANQIPTSLVVDDTMANTIDVGDVLLPGDDKANSLIYLKIRAKLLASTDGASTPTFDGWSMEFHCEPGE